MSLSTLPNLGYLHRLHSLVFNHLIIDAKSAEDPAQMLSATLEWLVGSL